MARHAQIVLDRDFTVAETDPRIFGSMIEHLGRAVYTGIYEPGHPSADANGFRQDVADLVRQLQVPVIRYPGGNFVSGFHWEDSVGPRESRPKRLDPAWKSLETNEIGLGEFHTWCEQVGSELMMAVNLGTRGIDEACALLEYCNFPGGTQRSEQRKQHGRTQPYGIRTWCLGNEMDGPWQTGHKTARDYGLLAGATARAMKNLDPEIELVVCGSSHENMETFPTWEEEVLSLCYEDVDYLSLHTYYGHRSGSSEDFLAKSDDMDRFIQKVLAACDYTKAKLRASKSMYLCFDEWNVWYHSGEQDKAYLQAHPWTVAPPLLEDVYEMEDALLIGLMMIVLLRHCDRVKIACLAQLVNVIAPIMTRPGGGAWCQTIYYPFMHASQYARGTVLQTITHSPCHPTAEHGDVTDVEAVAVLQADDSLTILCVNRNLTEDVSLEVTQRGFASAQSAEHIVLQHDDLHICNTEYESPVQPRTVSDAVIDPDGTLHAVLPAGSWNVLRVKSA